MKVEKDSKLFYVEFGEPETPGYYGGSGSSRQKPLYVIARTYDEAAKKAMSYVEFQQDVIQETKKIIDADGSLVLHTDDDCIKIKAVKLASEEIIY